MSLRILIVDDEPQMRNILRMIIGWHEGWEICGEAIDGLDGIRKAEELRPDLVLLDLSMPNLDGLSALPRIKEKNPQSGVLILTLHESLDLARLSSHAGANGYVCKSLAATELVPAMEAFEGGRNN